MNILWEHGPLFVREIVEYLPEPRPHFNTVATTVRILESKGYVAHEILGTSHRFRAIADRESFRSRSLSEVIRNYFDNSYKMAVSALIEDEKISIDELKEIVEMIEKNNNKTSET